MKSSKNNMNNQVSKVPLTCGTPVSHRKQRVKAVTNLKVPFIIIKRCKSKSWAISKISRCKLYQLRTTQQERFTFSAYISINSLLSKKYEIRCIASKTKGAITGMKESKVEHTVPDLEVNLPGFEILRCDRDKHGDRVAC